MQMGRWFGYRPHYEKICRIWITNTSANWYREIAEATEELKSELAHMDSLELTPREFGLRIRRDDTALEITARNKMRTAGKCEVRTTYWGDVFETPYFSTRVQDNIINIDATKSWLHRIIDNDIRVEKVHRRASFILHNVPVTSIADFLGTIHTSDKNLKFNRTNITNFIVFNKDELASWDVIVVGGTGSEIAGFFPNQNVVINASKRIFSVRGDGEGFSFTQQGVVSGNNDGSIGLDDPNRVKAEYMEKENTTKVNRCTWFKYVDRNPALFIYPVIASNIASAEPILADYLRNVGENPVMGFSIGIPGFGHESDARSYYTNIVYQNNDGLLETEEDE